MFIVNYVKFGADPLSRTTKSTNQFNPLNSI